METSILVAKGAQELSLLSQMANRHGLIAGATGTGKTVTLRVLAEGFSQLGVPVFMADVKGDLAGIHYPNPGDAKLKNRAQELGLTDYTPCGFPTVFWDVLGKEGHPVRSTISEMGPLLLSRLLTLNETQSGVLNIVFRVADENGFLLLDLKDLQAMVQHVGENAKEYTTKYGNVSTASIGAIQRNLLALEDQGADVFFGEPAFNIADLLQTDANGRGVINVLASSRLMEHPRVYATFLLWLLSELFENLPEAGDLEKPKLVFFFDEAHLLFDDAPKVLQEKIQQVVRLIRSKGVGIYFVSQNPLDIPDEVLGQLGNRVQHALRAFTPRDQKAVKSAAETFRANDDVDVVKVITELAIGEALVSFLDKAGAPTPVERGLIYPPRSRLGAISEQERTQIVRQSVLFGHYENYVDRESAYERLKGKAAQAQTSPSAAPVEVKEVQVEVPRPQAPAAPRSNRQSAGEAFVKSTLRSIGSQVGRQLVRGILGSFMGGSGARR